MNILLVTSAAPDKSPFFTNEKRPPLGVGSIISVLRLKGHNVFFIDNYLIAIPIYSGRIPSEKQHRFCRCLYKHYLLS